MARQEVFLSLLSASGATDCIRKMFECTALLPDHKCTDRSILWWAGSGER